MNFKTILLFALFAILSITSFAGNFRHGRPGRWIGRRWDSDCSDRRHNHNYNHWNRDSDCSDKKWHNRRHHRNSDCSDKKWHH